MFISNRSTFLGKTLNQVSQGMINVGTSYNDIEHTLSELYNENHEPNVALWTARRQTPSLSLCLEVKRLLYDNLCTVNQTQKEGGERTEHTKVSSPIPRSELRWIQLFPEIYLQIRMASWTKRTG